MRPLPSLLREGGRGVHGPAPASASLHRLRRQTVLRGTVNPSSGRHRWGPNGRSPGYGGGAGRIFPSSAHRPLSLGGAPIPPTCQSPPKPGRTVLGSREHAEGERGSMVLRRTVCGEAVERSAGRRRTVDPSPFYT